MATPPSPEVLVVSSRAAVARHAAWRFVAWARHALEARGRFCVALSGGATPRDLYALLATPEFSVQLDWERIHFFWGDERAVPPNHPDSNYRMANDALLSQVPVPPQNVHRILAEQPPDQAACAYAQTLQTFFNLDSAEDKSDKTRSTVPGDYALPRFDLVLLGLGADGHTASLFPHSGLLHETRRWVAAGYIDQVKMDRITLTAPVINHAASILFLVAGADKANAVREVLRGEYHPDDFPAQWVRLAEGHVVWLLDRQAAAEWRA